MSHFAYVTVLSRDEDLPGVVILAYSLRRNSSHLPLVVTCSKSVSSEVLDALRSEAAISLAISVEVVDLNSSVQHTDSPMEELSQEEINGTYFPIAESSSSVSQPQTADVTFSSQHDSTVLAFSPPVWSYETVCYLSPTSVVARHGMDLIFTEAQLPTDSCVAAVPLCTCPNVNNFNLSHRVSCPFLTQADPRTPLRRMMSFSASVAASSPIEPGAMAPKESKPDDRVVVFYPGEMLWDKMKDAYREIRFDDIKEEKKQLEDAEPQSKDNIEDNGGQNDLGVEKSQGKQELGNASFGDIEITNAVKSTRLVEKVFKDKWAALPWYYSVSEGLRQSHWGLVAGNDTSSICFQVEPGAWKDYEKRNLQEKVDETPAGESNTQLLDTEVDGKPLKPAVNGSKLKFTVSEPEPDNGVNQKIDAENQAEQERLSLKLVTSLPEGRQGRAWQVWKSMYEAWTNSLMERGENENELARLVQKMMGITPSGPEEVATASSDTARSQGSVDMAKRKDVILSPINEVSPASEGHHHMRSFESAYLSMYRPRAMMERGHGPVVHRSRPTPTPTMANSTRPQPES